MQKVAKIVGESTEPSSLISNAQPSPSLEASCLSRATFL